MNYHRTGEPQAHSAFGQQQPRVHLPRSALLNLTTKTNRELFCCAAMLEIKMVITQTIYRFCQTKCLSVHVNKWLKCNTSKDAGPCPVLNCQSQKNRMTQVCHRCTTKQQLHMHLVLSMYVSQIVYP